MARIVPSPDFPAPGALPCHPDAGCRLHFLCCLRALALNKSYGSADLNYAQTLETVPSVWYIPAHVLDVEGE